MPGCNAGVYLKFTIVMNCCRRGWQSQQRNARTLCMRRVLSSSWIKARIEHSSPSLTPAWQIESRWHRTCKCFLQGRASYSIGSASYKVEHLMTLAKQMLKGSSKFSSNDCDRSAGKRKSPSSTANAVANEPKLVSSCAHIKASYTGEGICLDLSHLIWRLYDVYKPA